MIPSPKGGTPRSRSRVAVNGRRNWPFGPCADHGDTADTLPMSRSSARSRTAIRSFAVSFLALLCLGLVAPPAGAATGDVTEFTIPTPVSLPQGIVVGPDGVSWFAQRSANAIGSLSNGTFSQYPLPNAGSAPFWVALGLRRERVVHGALREPDRQDHIDGRDHRVPDPDRRQSARRDHGRARRCAVVHRTDRQPDRTDHHRG